VSKAKGFKCPFGKCGQSGYPQPTWKTEAGLERHKLKCRLNPDVQRQDDEKITFAKKQADIAVSFFLEENTPDLAVGQQVWYIEGHDVKPTHVNRGGRMVRVRYEAERRFSVREMIIEKITALIGWDKKPYFSFQNSYVAKCRSDLFTDKSMAVANAESQQKKYDEHVEFSRFCR
jgi:hypothetical protein